MKKYKVGVVGLGKMGMLHGALSNYHSVMHLTAICEKAFFMRNMYKNVMPEIHYYEDYEKMIVKESLDAIIVTTPTSTHFDIVSKALGQGMHVFVEKPMVRTFEEAKQLEKIFLTSGAKSMVGFVQRYEPSFEKGRTLLKSGIVGDILKVDAAMFLGDVLAESKAWRFNPEIAGGGVLIDFGIHMIDLLVWYFGAIKAVKASGRKIVSSLVEDEMTAQIMFQSGVQASFITSWSREEYRKATPLLHIEGTGGTLDISCQSVEYVSSDGKTEQWTPPDIYPGAYINVAGVNFSREIDAFGRLLAGDDITVTDIVHGTYIQKIIDCMYKSDARKHEVEVA